MPFSGMYQMYISSCGFLPATLIELSLRWNLKYYRKDHQLTDLWKEPKKKKKNQTITPIWNYQKS